MGFGKFDYSIDSNAFVMKNGLIIDEDGDHIWYKDDQYHREDGPAMEWDDGDKMWFLNGDMHRVDGPAAIFADGDQEWYLHGKQLSQPKAFGTMEEWLKYLNQHEEQTYQRIHDHNGFIGFIDKPSGKQTRVHQMAHLI